MRALSACVVACEGAALVFHFVGGLPGAGDDFADAAHRLRVGGNHGKHAQIVQNVFGGDGFAADADIGEGHIFGDLRNRDGGKPSACRDALRWC